MMLKLTLPFPPSANTHWRHYKGRVLISEAGRKYRTAVDWEVMNQRGALSLACRLKVALILYPPDKRKRDLDNFFKSLLDSLTRSGVWMDDSQIDDLSIVRGIIIPSGKVAVTITEIKDGPGKKNSS